LNERRELVKRLQQEFEIIWQASTQKIMTVSYFHMFCLLLLALFSHSLCFFVHICLTTIFAAMLSFPHGLFQNVNEKKHCQKLTSPLYVPVSLHLYDSWISVLNKQ